MQFDYGVAGKSTREMSKRRFRSVHVLGAVLFGIAALLLFNMDKFLKLGLLVTAIMVTAFLLLSKQIERKGLTVKKRARDAERGAIAEERVADKLSNLSEGNRSFHDISFSGFNIDHVVIGPGGVFLIETKSHRGKVDTNGKSLLLDGKLPEKDFLKQTWSQSFHLKDFLYKQTSREWKVNPILCFTNASVDVREPVRGITVSSLGYLNQHLSKQPKVLSVEDIEHLSRILSFWNARDVRKG